MSRKWASALGSPVSLDPRNRRHVALTLGLVFLYAVLATVAHLIRNTEDYHGSITEIDYAFGALIESILNGQGYRVEREGIAYTAHRLPFIPLFLSGLGLITTHVAFSWMVKNLLVFTVSWFAFWLVVREARPRLIWVLIAGAVYFLVPWNFVTLTKLDFEETYLGHLLPALGALLFVRSSPKRLWLSGALVAVAALTKSSMFVPLLFVVAFLLVRDWRPWRHWALIPSACLAAAMLGWGLWCLRTSGHFAFGPSSSSYNGINFYKGNNPLTSQYYPLINLDELTNNRLLVAPPELRDEWAIDRYFTAQARTFIAENPRESLANTLQKLSVAFWSVQRVGIVPKRGEKPGLNPSMVLNRAVQWAGLGLALLWLFRRRWGLRGTSIAYLGLVGSYTLPFLVGFANHRHMTPVYLMTCVFLLYALGRIQSRDPRESIERDAGLPMPVGSPDEVAAQDRGGRPDGADSRGSVLAQDRR